MNEDIKLFLFENNPFPFGVVRLDSGNARLRGAFRVRELRTLFSAAVTLIVGVLFCDGDSKNKPAFTKTTRNVI